MKDNTYNGWTNYETWNWKLWIDNDYGSYEYWREQAQALNSSAKAQYDFETDRDAAIRALAEQLEEDSEQAAEQFMASQSGPFADLLNAAVGRIEWREIATSMIDDLD